MRRVAAGRSLVHSRAQAAHRRDMWESKIDTLRHGCVRLRTLLDGKPLSYRKAVELWTTEADFRDWFSHLLLDAPFEAYCWEPPPVAFSSLDRAFESVLVDVPALCHLRADRPSFAVQFARCKQESSVVSFSNLGGDALLVAPRPIGVASAYSHLASFLRHAPQTQRDALWQVVGAAIEQQLGDDPLWVSTAGLGVSWLHVRLDTRPKYYRFDAYRRAA